jgi:hypothetical protein
MSRALIAQMVRRRDRQFDILRESGDSGPLLQSAVGLVILPNPEFPFVPKEESKWRMTFHNS